MGGPDPISNQLLPSLGVSGLRGKMSYYLSFTATKQDAYRNYNAYMDPGVVQQAFRSRDILGFNISDRFVNGSNLEAKFTVKATPTMRLNFAYQGSWDDFTGWNWNYLYSAQTAPDVHETSRLLSVKLSQNLSKSTFYQVQLSQFYKDYLERPGDPNQPGSGLNPDQFLLNTEVDKFSRTNDVNKNGKWDPAEQFENQYEDYNVDGTPRYTFGDQYQDKNGDGRYTSGVDSLTWDWNGNGQIDFNQGEPFTDRDNDGQWDNKESFIDGNNNGVYDEDRRDVF